jgi:hypothetical protein
MPAQALLAARVVYSHQATGEASRKAAGELIAQICAETGEVMGEALPVEEADARLDEVSNALLGAIPASKTRRHP